MLMHCIKVYEWGVYLRNVNVLCDCCLFAWIYTNDLVLYDYSS